MLVTYSGHFFSNTLSYIGVKIHFGPKKFKCDPHKLVGPILEIMRSTLISTNRRVCIEKKVLKSVLVAQKNKIKSKERQEKGDWEKK